MIDSVLCLFNTVSLVGLQCTIVVFLDYTSLILLYVFAECALFLSAFFYIMIATLLTKVSGILVKLITLA